jgi:hypothetical protein
VTKHNKRYHRRQISSNKPSTLTKQQWSRTWRSLNTNVTSVTNISPREDIWKHIWWYILERSLISVKSVTNISLTQGIWQNIWWYTLERSLISVKSVTNISLDQVIFENIWGYTVMIKITFVKSVSENSSALAKREIYQAGANCSTNIHVCYLSSERW